MHFKMSSTICFRLDQSQILSSGNGLKEKKKVAGKPNCKPSVERYNVLEC